MQAGTCIPAGTVYRVPSPNKTEEAFSHRKDRLEKRYWWSFGSGWVEGSAQIGKHFSRTYNIQSELHWYLIVWLQSAELSGHATKRRCDVVTPVCLNKEHFSNHCAFELYMEIVCSLSACFPSLTQEVGHQQKKKIYWRNTLQETNRKCGISDVGSRH